MPSSIPPPISKQGPDRRYLNHIWAWFWDGGGIEGGTLEVYDFGVDMQLQGRLGLV